MPQKIFANLKVFWKKKSKFIKRSPAVSTDLNSIYDPGKKWYSCSVCIVVETLQDKKHSVLLQFVPTQIRIDNMHLCKIKVSQKKIWNIIKVWMKVFNGSLPGREWVRYGRMRGKRKILIKLNSCGSFILAFHSIILSFLEAQGCRNKNSMRFCGIRLNGRRAIDFNDFFDFCVFLTIYKILLTFLNVFIIFFQHFLTNFEWFSNSF